MLGIELCLIDINMTRVSNRGLQLLIPFKYNCFLCICNSNGCGTTYLLNRSKVLPVHRSTHRYSMGSFLWTSLQTPSCSMEMLGHTMDVCTDAKLFYENARPFYGCLYRYQAVLWTYIQQILQSS
jgi:hypothetical protein